MFQQTLPAILQVSMEPSILWVSFWSSLTTAVTPFVSYKRLSRDATF